MTALSVSPLSDNWFAVGGPPFGSSLGSRATLHVSRLTDITQYRLWTADAPLSQASMMIGFHPTLGNVMTPLTNLREPIPFRGTDLRYLLTLAILDRGLPITVQELCRQLERWNVATQGRMSKDISDALRWEIDRARVRRVGRSTYVSGHIARQTAWRMRKRVARHMASSRAGMS